MAVAAVGVTAAMVAVVITAGGNGERTPTSSSRRTTSTTAAPAPTSTTSAEQMAAALPVAACDTQFAATGQTLPPIRPTIRVELAGASASRLQFYSNGRITVLAPRGWTCRALVAANGGENLAVTPPGESLAAPSQVVQGVREYTAHGPGVELVCPYFPNSPAGRVSASYGFTCRGLGPESQITRPNADIALFTEAPVAGKPGPATVGAVLYPQSNNPDSRQSTDVALVSCRLADARDLCDAVVSDFVVRQFPDPRETPSGCPDRRALDAAVRVTKSAVIPEALGPMPGTHCFDDLAGLQYGPPNSDVLAHHALLRNVDGRWVVVATGATLESVQARSQVSDSMIHTLFRRSVGDSGYGVTAQVFLRSRPSVDAEVLGEIPSGARVYVECVTQGDTVNGPWGPTANWDRVTWFGTRGFVTDEYVDTKEEINDRSRIPLC